MWPADLSFDGWPTQWGRAAAMFLRVTHRAALAIRQPNALDLYQGWTNWPTVADRSTRQPQPRAILDGDQGSRSSRRSEVNGNPGAEVAQRIVDNLQRVVWIVGVGARILTGVEAR